MDRKELKQTGKNLFKKNYWRSVLIAFLIYLGSSGGFSYSSSSSSSDTSAFGGFDFTHVKEFIFSTPIILALSTSAIALAILGYFVFNSLRCGSIRYFLKSKKNQPVELKEAIENFKDKTFLNIAKVTFFKDLYTFLWTLLFIIPGIIKSYEYWAIDYILAVRPDIDKDEAKRLSKILMDGNKWELFVLELSFLGWLILSIFTGGILFFLYVNPYMQATFVEFFSEIRLEALAKGTITPNDIPDYEFYNPQPQFSPYFTGENNGFNPNGMPMNNMGYTQQPQQPFGQPMPQPFAQPMEQTSEQPQEPVSASEPEPVTEESDANTPDANN